MPEALGCCLHLAGWAMNHGPSWANGCPAKAFWRRFTRTKWNDDESRWTGPARAEAPMKTAQEAGRVCYDDDPGSTTTKKSAVV